MRTYHEHYPQCPIGAPEPMAGDPGPTSIVECIQKERKTFYFILSLLFPRANIKIIHNK
jgi:hypothetical protein